nr:MAG TPA: ECF sigma factor [Caudoviricetes sp.]DAY37208.1 MAG TPA: ECF sigma factor [Caudoviricetes sp.]
MARLTPELWEAARADYEIRGMSQRDIARKYGVSAGTVGERASKEGWEQGKAEQLRADKSNAIIALAKTERETEQKLSRTERAVLDAVVMDDVAFRAQNDADLEAVCKHIMALLPGVDKPADAKVIVEALRIARECRLGKTPDTAIQINNNAPARIERVIVDAH